MAEHASTDAEGEILHRQYIDLVETIKRNMDPRSNTVLLVDDERGIRMKVARDVKAFDPSIVVYEAGNGKDALEKLTQIRKTHVRDPLFIVLDLNMPIMDGWAVIAKLKEEYESKGRASGIPIIVLSSTSGEKNVAFIMKKSVHESKSGYIPLVTVAKETCVDKRRYDAAGEPGLMNWLDYFVRKK
ncbi:MAG: response regulator [bacterium]